MISQETIQQILSRIDIVEIVGSFIKLKKRGTNYLGLCPFHNEKTPSFTVSPSKEIYKCFGCGKSGNSISFLMEAEKYSYVEALRWLAAKYNVEIEETETSPEIKKQQQVADSLYIINNFAQKFYNDYLFNTEEGRDIGLSYLKQRGFREEIINKFQLGYSPDSKDTFSKVALAKQYDLELLRKAGFVVVRDDVTQDNYRGRIIFPIHNQSGKVLGFGARIIKKNDKAPKYINTPENEIYIKSKILYGSYFARQAIDKADECLLVEGYTDVISLHQAGIENVVASGGTSLTPDQIRFIKKYTKNLTIIYDGDNAGIKAALRGLDLALEESMNVNLVLIPDNEDPDSYVNKIGSKAFIDFIDSNKKDVILFQLENSLTDALNDTNKKSQLVNQIAETISRINKPEDFTKRQDYIKRCSEILQIKESGLLDLVNKFLRNKLEKEFSKSNFSDKENKFENSDLNLPEPNRNDWSNEAYSLLFQDDLIEKGFTGVLLKYGDKQWDANKTVAKHIFEEILEDEEKNELPPIDIFQNDKIIDIFNLYKSWMDKGKIPSLHDFTYYHDKDLVQLVVEITNVPYEVSQKWFEDDKQNKVFSKVQKLSYEDFMNEIINNTDPDRNIYYDVIDESYKDEVNIGLIYIKLRKIKRLIERNQEDYNNGYEDTDSMISVHKHLKEIQQQLGKKRQIVYYPF